MEFVNWTTLATYAGALAMVVVITQVTKEWKGIRKLPTQLWTYIVSLIVLYPAAYFTGTLDRSNAVLILFNSMILTLSANGGFDALVKMFPELFKKE